MNTRARTIVILLSLGLGLAVGLVFRSQVRDLRTRQRHDLWLSYVRGPLTLYIQGSRGGELLTPSSPTPAQRARLGEAVLAMHDAWVQAVGMQPDFESDAYFFDLDRGTQWYTSAEQLEDTWPALERDRRDEVGPAKQAAEGMRGNLALLVGQQWALLSEDLSWTPEEKKESQDAVEALSRPSH